LIYSASTGGFLGKNESIKEVVRMKRRHQIILFLSIVVFALFSLECGSKNGSPIKIKSAKRANRVLLGTSQFNSREIYPIDRKTGVILVLKIKGISIKAFQNIDKSDEEEIYVMAGEQKFKPTVMRYGTIAGKEGIELYIGVPRDVLELTLYVGSFPPKTFKVKGKILDELRD
jgi:hypothetical protein